MKKKFKNTSVFLGIFAFIIFPLFVFAAIETTPPGGTAPVTQPIRINNPLVGGTNNLTDFVVLVLNNVIMPIAAVLATLYIIYSGFLYVTAQGNPKKIQDAHQNLLWALIGTGVLLGAAGISKVVQSTVESLIK